MNDRRLYFVFICFIFNGLPLCASGFELKEIMWKIDISDDPAINEIIDLTPKTFSGSSRLRKIDPLLVPYIGDGQHSKGLTLLDNSLSSVSIEDNKISVKLYANNKYRLKKMLNRNDIDTTAEFDNIVTANVTASELERLGQLDDLYYIAPQPLFYPSYSYSKKKILTEGVGKSKVGPLHNSGITGKGVKVGVIDFGFKRYNELLKKGRVPQPIKQKAFNSQQSMVLDSVHGTACAEIISEMAPDAEIYLAAISGRSDEIINATQWLIAQGVDIISFSGGGHDGPHNGEAILDRLVDDTVQKHDILWVNAAGNDGDSHWSGETVDRNKNGFIDIGSSGKDVFLIKPLVNKIQLRIYWNDWGDKPSRPSSNQDINAYLFSVNAQTGQLGDLIAKSETPQNGSKSRPIETIAVRAQAGQTYLMVLKAQNITKNVPVHILAMSGMVIEPKTRSGSIGIPATAKNALSVAAVNVLNDTLENYSSQGPTDDLRLKPDIAASDNNLSVAYGIGQEVGRFKGTSAACPHVTGFSALVKQLYPQLKGKALKIKVLENVSAIDSSLVARPNNLLGHGHIDATRLTRSLQTTRPAPESTIEPDSGGNSGHIEPSKLDDLLNSF
jgi:subtilisin family serine protease